MFGSGFMQPRGPGTIPQDFDNPFGLPQFDVPDFGGPTSIPTASPKKGGMFGSGMGAKEVLGRLISGYLAGRGNPVGSIGLHMINQRRNLAQQQQLAAQDRENDFQDFVRREAYKAAHPSPINNDTVADYNFIRSVLGDDEGANYLRNKANPPQLMNVPGVGVVQIPRMAGPTQQGPQPGHVEDGFQFIGGDPSDKNNWKQVGGPTPQASGGFRSPY